METVIEEDRLIGNSDQTIVLMTSFGALGDKLLPYTHLEYLPFKADSQGFGAKPCREADLACRARLFYTMFLVHPL